MKYLPLLLLLISCSHTETEITRDDNCPAVQITLEPGQVWEERDRERLAEIKEGCIRRSGPNACIVRVNKVRDQGYWVICRRGK